MEKLFIIKREFIPGNCFFCHNLCNFRMAVWKFFPFSGLIGGSAVFIGWKKILPAGFLDPLTLDPEAANEIIIRAKRRKGIRRAANYTRERKGFPDSLALAGIYGR